MTTKSNDIEDVQNRADTRELPIHKVGIKDIEHPIRVLDRSGGEQPTVARLNMFVELPHNFKGTHMSRFVEILEENDADISVRSFRGIVTRMRERLEAARGHLEMSFPYFMKKTAPVSGVESLMNYQVTLIGDCSESSCDITMKVVVPVTSLCPCSKGISDYGAHSQRSHITISAQTSEFVWLEELVDIAERQASSELYGILKRPDEKHVTERAYDNPKFVEDLVRDIAVELNNDKRVVVYTVEAENFESIHNHSAYALIERDKRTDTI